MSRRLPPLNALRAFEVAARTGSFTRAAETLRVSQGAISRQIAHLEAFLQIPLFDRKGKQLTLTQHGLAYSRVVTSALEQIERETQRLLPTGRQLSLRIKTFPSFAERWLVPRLGGFQATHPDVDVQITTSMQAAELLQEHVDLTIERVSLRQRDAIYDPLFEIELVPVCTREHVIGPPPIEKPADVLQHPLLHALNRPNDWKRWLETAGVSELTIPRGLEFGNSSMVYQAAAHGAGIAIAQSRFVEDDVADGRLVAPFKLAVPTGEIYYLVSLPKQSYAASAFRDWVLAESRNRRVHFGTDSGAVSLSAHANPFLNISTAAQRDPSI